MLNFTDRSKFLKGTGTATLYNPCTMQALYSTSNITQGNISSSVTMGEIRAGLGNPIVCTLPSDSQLQVDFTAADFSLAMKAGQVGATLSYDAPSPECQVVTATGTTLQIDVANGAPVSPPGFPKAICQVQETGVAGTIADTGVAYDIAADGTVAGFTAEVGKKYRVHYWVRKPVAQQATISSLFNPNVYYFVAQFPVFANENCNASNEGSRIGWLYVVIPRLKMGGNAGITGDQTNADTTSLSGQALAYTDEVVSETCDDGVPDLGYYIYVPDVGANLIKGLAVIGGLVTVAAGKTAQIPVKLVMENGQLVNPSNYASDFTYVASDAPSGTSVSNAGVITAGETAGEFEVAITYDNDGETLTTPVNVAVVA